MALMEQAQRELVEVIDIVLTMRICHCNHRMSNSALKKCAFAMSKRMKEKFTYDICIALSKSNTALKDTMTVQRKLLEKNLWRNSTTT